jgi:hypothetical protein
VKQPLAWLFVFEDSSVVFSAAERLVVAVQPLCIALMEEWRDTYETAVVRFLGWILSVFASLP